MFKNNLPISTLIGIFITGIGFVLLCACSNFVYDFMQNQEEIDNILIFACIGTIILIVIGLSFFLRTRWSRPVSGFLLTILFLYCAYMLFTIARQSYSSIFQIVGTGGVLITTYLSFILLLYNQKVSAEFGVNHSEKELDDIIDLYE